MKLIFGFIFVALASSALSAEDTPEDLFRQGKWQEAANGFRSAIQNSNGLENASRSSLYNFGTSLAKAGAWGEAHAVLLKAYFKNPFDSDLTHNISLVEKKLSPTALSIIPSHWLPWWPASFRGVNFSTWLLLALVALAPGLRLFFVHGNRLSGYISSGLSFLLILIGIIGAIQSRYPSAAVINSTKMRSGPDSSFEVISHLDSGSLVSVEESRDNWQKIRFQKPNSQDSVGWVESNAILIVLK